ncbi:MAG TPA: LysE family translocator [Telluria sp.]|nr:LysE family translocator [Telluria sp.]
MSHAALLWLYFVVVFGIVVLPGMDMAYVMGTALLGGRRTGFAAVAGIVAGGGCHVTMGALGVAAVLTLWPPLYNVMLVVGALYIGWMGIGFLRSTDMFLPTSGGLPAALAPSTAFRRALATSLINPKAYLFMLAVFPQFLKPGYGPVWMQAGALGLITWATQAAVYGALALAAAQATEWFRTKPQASANAARLMGALLVGVALFTLAQLR